jgi:hydroxymethylglutaryl-CoA lyase
VTHPKVFARMARGSQTRYTALVPNLAGLDRAAAAGLREIAIFAASSESFSRANINQGIDESFASYAVVAERARAMGMRVRGYLSTAFGCPYEGAVPPERVADLSRA